MVVKVALVVVLAVIAVYGALWALQRKMIYQADTSPVPPAADVIPGAQDVTLSTDDGLELGAWLVPPDPAADRGIAVLFAPGNGGNREGRADLAQLLSDRGFTVLLMDYRGYGGNPGSPSEDGLASDAAAAAEFLAQQGFSPQQTIYFGESLGSAVVARLQEATPPAGVVMRSPFTSMADVAADIVPWAPVGLLLRDEFPVTEYVAASDVPTTVIWATADTLIDPAMSEQVADAAEQNGHLVEAMTLPGANHNDPVTAGAEVADAVVRLAEAIA
ncbi:alpha/beta hydrolase [Epidermidibacterium keratini]|uniref:alpha/beta hydrolase n=1 Tax=Epidermidibacterium keratini TaxID=1891644 RepID=UPI001CEF6E18|nr:alpha/beta hydrolase [Epidermidibacterium keratini]